MGFSATVLGEADMLHRDEEQLRSTRDVPPVGRPRGATWRSLQADGVVWEGQVLLVGADVDLAARMIVTHRRLVFVRGGDVVLEIPRDWLRPEPVVRRDGVFELFIVMPGSDIFAEPVSFPIRMREGHAAAGHIIAMLAPGGVRRIAPDALSGIERAREAAPPPRFGGFWDGIEDGTDLGGTKLIASPGKSREKGNQEAPEPELTRLEPPDRVLRLSSAPQPRPLSPAFPISGVLPRDQRRSPWTLLLRVIAVTVLLATAAALGAGRLTLPRTALNAVLSAPTPVPAVSGSPVVTPATSLSPQQETAMEIGVGGEGAEATGDATSAGAAVAQTDAATVTPAPAATAAPAAVPSPTPTAAPAPTSTPPPAPVAVASPTMAALAPPAPAAATPNQTLQQPAAVAPDSPPAQELVLGQLRLAITSALHGESLPKFGLPPGSGNWVVLRLNLRNDGDAPASLAMGDLRLFDRNSGTVADLDGGTNVIAKLAGLDPAWSPTDVVPVEPNATAEALAVFLLPPGSSDDLALIVGQSSIDLAPSLALENAAPAETPQLVQGSVTDVIDGGRIAVSINGAPETVQYLGLQAPVAGACFAAEAKDTNAQLVAGQTVMLERQASDRGADGTLLRDVWITGTDGQPALIAARLIEAGAAVPAVAAPDTRYQAWLAASAALGRTNGAGMWAVCGQPSAATTSDSPRLAFMVGGWRDGRVSGLT
jgi:endonuclease YncB( thermonuclease family)